MKDQQNTLPQPLLVELESTGKDLIATVKAISEDDFNSTPFGGKWSAGENAEHVRLSVAGMIPVLNSPGITTNRAPDEHVKGIKSMFLDFNAKYTSAPAITPAVKRYDKQLLIEQLTETFGEIAKVAAIIDLTDTCSVEFNGIGQLTGLEWVSVVIYHTQRHTHQLNLIAEKLRQIAG